MLSRIRRALSAISKKDASSMRRLGDTPDDPSEIFCIRIFNDDVTPSGFVIGLLQEHLDLSHYKATQAMLKVHCSDSAPFGRMSEEVAHSVVTAMRQEIESGGMSLRIAAEHWMTGRAS